MSSPEGSVNNLFINIEPKNSFEQKNNVFLNFDGTPDKTIFPLFW